MANTKNTNVIIPPPSLRRFPIYFAYLKEQQAAGKIWISSAVMADELNLHPVQVRKDLALTSVVGRPRTGFNINDLLLDFRRLLDYDNVKPAVLIGSGHLGSALLAYQGFGEFGLKLVAAFDSDPQKVNTEVSGVKVHALEDLKKIVQKQKIKIGIITVPATEAQNACDILLEAGIKAIWNFAPIHLFAPKNIILQHENIAVSLSVLSKRLYDSEDEQ